MEHLNNIPNFFSGTSGLVLPLIKTQYPTAFQGKSRLTYYSSLYKSVEINSSFYKVPMVSTVGKWEASVPDDFQFSFKLSKEITHVKGFDFKPPDVIHFMETIAAANNNCGCLLIQFPASLHADKIRQLEKLLNIIRKADAKITWKVAIEFRHVSWYNEELYDLLKQFGACLVMHDIAASAPDFNIITADFIYLRYHGAGKLYRGSYSNAHLSQQASYIKACIKKGKIVYAYFNNTMGDATNNLNTLNKLVGTKSD